MVAVNVEALYWNVAACEPLSEPKTTQEESERVSGLIFLSKVTVMTVALATSFAFAFGVKDTTEGA
jgi:hypothetical protein